MTAPADADPRRLETVLARAARALVAADADDAAGRALRALDLTLVLRDPAGDALAVHLGGDAVALVDDAARMAEPRVVVVAQPHLLDRVFSGGLALSDAIGAQSVAVEGPVDRVLLLCARLGHAAPAYRRLLRREIADAADAEPEAVGT